MDYVGIAAAMLAEVGLSFDDVLDTGRPWIMGTGPFTQVIARPAYAGSCAYPNRDNPTSRQRCLISLTGPIDSDEMLHLLAHECGHAQKPYWTSVKLYIQEYHAEMYASNAFARHTGRWPHDYIINRGKKYVRKHCWMREQSMSEFGRIEWAWEIVEWCGFKPNPKLIRERGDNL